MPNGLKLNPEHKKCSLHFAEGRSFAMEIPFLFAYVGQLIFL